MKLTHLGASYTPSNQVVETVETDTQLSFLGRPFKMRVAKAAPGQHRHQRLTYRGVGYSA